MAKLEKSERRRQKLGEFKRWSKRLRDAAQDAFDAELASDETLRPRDRADNVFRLMAYRYYRDLKRAGLIDALREHVEQRDRGRWARHRGSDELWVIRLVAEGEQTDRMRKKRDRWAAELKLANVNDVQPELLLGFLHEAGPTDLIEQDAKGGERYPWAECYREAKAAEKHSRKGLGGRKASDDPDATSRDGPSWQAETYEAGDRWSDDEPAYSETYDDENGWD